MKFGITLPDPVEGPMDIAVVARKAEALGFESIWMGEHPIIPVNTASVCPFTPDGKMPTFLPYMPDPFMGLARASAVTSTLKLGTGICLVPERNPLLLAKQIATLDYFSGGRFLFGIGVGWLQEETEIMGGDFSHRWSQTREAVEAMKELWTKDESEYHGRYYDFPPVRCFPKPAQKPHPPVILGGTAKNALRRVVAWGDGWMPDIATLEGVKAGRATLDELATVAGRDPTSIEISVVGRPPDREDIDPFVEAGADRVTIGLSVTSTEEAEARLESIARQFLG